MRIAPALMSLLALGLSVSAAIAAPERKAFAFRAVVYFVGNKSDASGPYSEVVLKPRSSAAATVHLRGTTLDEKLAKAYLEIEFETTRDCSLGCDASLRKFIDVVNPVDVRNHPLRGFPKRLSP